MKIGVHITVLVLATCFQVSMCGDLLEDKPSVLLAAICTINGKLVEQCVNDLQSRMLVKIYSNENYRKRMQSVRGKESSKLGLLNKRGRDDTEGFYSNW